MYQPEILLKQFFETFSKSTLADFRNFLEHNSNVKKWIISSDYCLHDKNRPNNCMAFSILPYDTNFSQFKEEIQSVMGKDIKKVRQVSDAAIDFLNDPRFFHFVFLIPDEFTLFTNGNNQSPLEISRKCAEITLQQTIDMERGDERIKRAKKLLQSSKPNNFNHQLLSDLLLASYFFAFINLALAKENKPEIIGWFSDRDKMTEWCDGILWDFFTESVRGLAASQNIDFSNIETPISVPDQETQTMWFDHIVRISDYMAGTVSSWNMTDNTVCHAKFVPLIEKLFADSKNSVILGFKEIDEGLQWRKISVSLTQQ